MSGSRRPAATPHGSRSEKGDTASARRVLLLQRGRHPRLDPELPRGPLPGAPVTAQARGPVRLRLLTADARHRGPKGHLGDQWHTARLAAVGPGAAWTAGVTSRLRAGGAVAKTVAGIGRNATFLERGGLGTTEKPPLARDSPSGPWAFDEPP